MLRGVLRAFSCTKMREKNRAVLRASAITQPKGHAPFLIFRYLSLTSLGLGIDNYYASFNK